MTQIIIAKDFTEFPGPRLREDGDFSGEEFFEDILKPKFESLGEDEKLTINLDGTYGYPSSFLSESFGRLYSEALELMREKIQFISNEDRSLVDFIEYLSKDYVQ